MDKISLLLSALLGLAMVIFIAPGILRLNQGRVLRNIALWIAIFLGLALVYKTFGPFPMGTSPAPVSAPATPGEARETDKDESNDSDKGGVDGQDYQPPREE